MWVMILPKLPGSAHQNSASLKTRLFHHAVDKTVVKQAFSATRLFHHAIHNSRSCGQETVHPHGAAYISEQRGFLHCPYTAVQACDGSGRPQLCSQAQPGG